MITKHDGEPLRPRDLALLLLASGDLRPRLRARDQQADRAGLDLKRQLLDSLAAVDPEPEDLDDALAGIVAKMDGPAGPARAIALSIKEEWQAACVTPEWLGLLLHQATQEPGPRKGNKAHGRLSP
jgi:hypothetical protein